jgi:cytochrome c oxidase subunit IV
MEHHTPLSEITHHHEPPTSTKRIWRTFWILLVLTVFELLLGFAMYFFDMPAWVVMFLKGIIVILTLAKAFYIVSIFMHLGDEIRNMIMTIVVPLMLFIWFIAAFLWDGSSYRHLRNRYDKAHAERSTGVPQNRADTARHPLH